MNTSIEEKIKQHDWLLEELLNDISEVEMQIQQEKAEGQVELKTLAKYFHHLFRCYSFENRKIFSHLEDSHGLCKKLWDTSQYLRENYLEN